MPPGVAVFSDVGARQARYIEFRNGVIPRNRLPAIARTYSAMSPNRGGDFLRCRGHADDYQTQQRAGRSAVRADIAGLAGASRHACADRQQEQVCLPQRFDFIR